MQKLQLWCWISNSCTEVTVSGHFCRQTVLSYQSTSLLCLKNIARIGGIASFLKVAVQKCWFCQNIMQKSPFLAYSVAFLWH